MQEVWQVKVDWDESVPETIHSSWSEFVRELDLLNNISFGRQIFGENSKDTQVHGFCDASMVGYGACLYLRTIDPKDEVSCRLLCAKSKVAPLKPVTIPRLELCGAQLLVHLYEEAARVFNFSPSQTIFWTDSTIVLHWLKMSPSSLKTYAANRVTEIQEKTKGFSWRHVRSEDNPADASSRGQLPSVFLKNNLWVNGPFWLQRPEIAWPAGIETLKEVPELKKNVCLHVNSDTPAVGNEPDCLMYIKRFSSYSRLLRVTACIIRLMPSKRINGLRRDLLSAEEIAEAEIRILKFIQSIHFTTEINQIKTTGSTQKSKLASLCPILDENGLLRVGGRLKNSSLSYMQKHPIFLPSRNYLTDLIIRETHLKNYHSGIQSTLHALRHKFWILDGKNQVRKITRECMRCFRFKAEAVEYKMGNLPEVRVNNATVFDNVGIDYCGPFFIKEKKRYNKVKIKVYVCVFICMAIKAVHLEIVCDMSTEGFLGALRRFIARRGTPSRIYSDNGTNFVGANNQLRELYALFNSDEHKYMVDKFGTQRRIEWHFIPPLSPHQGGLWESTVKLFKHHLKRVVGDSVFTLDELGTFTAEIEGILNSRPLTPLSSDPNDLSALTPALYLLGKPSTSLPERDLMSTPTNRLSVWEHVAKIRQDFWRRWNTEYLNELQKRPKWFKDGNNIKINEMVLIKDKNLPCTQWKLGRVIEVHPGDENIIRTVTVRTANGVLKRSVKLLCPLPLDQKL